MIWDKASKYYDFFENIYNGKVYKELGNRVSKYIASTDDVLECACGTGCITKSIAAKCMSLKATDYSDGMLKQVTKACKEFENVTIGKMNILSIDAKDDTYDKVVAGNVIHLLPDPKVALAELMRVCKPEGKIIIPTYVNICKDGKPSLIVRILKMVGVKFKRQFSPESYRDFFHNMGFENVTYDLVEGKMPCCIAVISKR